MKLGGLHASRREVDPQGTLPASLDDGRGDPVVAGSRIGLLDILPAATAGPAHDHHAGRRRSGDVGGQAREAAVVRGHKHITGIRAGGHKRFQSGPFKITRQEKPPADRLHRHHDARLVVGNAAHRLAITILPAARMQHPHAARVVKRKRVISRHRANGNSGLPGQQEKLADSGRVAMEEGLRYHDLTDRESFDQIGHGIEMVGIGVGDHERVDVADPLVPEHALHRSPCCPGCAEATGIVDKAASPGAADHHAAAVPQRRRDSPQAGGPRRHHALQPAPHDPDDHPAAGHEPPGERLPQTIPCDPEQGCHQAGIPTHHPPSRRPGHPGIGRRKVGRHFDDGRQAGQCVIAHPAAAAGNRGRNAGRGEA
jgi:hypothetical protein